MESILTSIKKLLGITEDYTHFDTDIIIHINTVFLILAQLGIGPKTGFSIGDNAAIWDDFLETDSPLYEAVKSYMYFKVRLMFDPPQSTSVIESINRTIAELEERLKLQAEADQANVL